MNKTEVTNVYILLKVVFYFLHVRLFSLLNLNKHNYQPIYIHACIHVHVYIYTFMKTFIAPMYLSMNINHVFIRSHFGDVYKIYGQLNIRSYLSVLFNYYFVCLLCLEQHTLRRIFSSLCQISGLLTLSPWSLDSAYMLRR